MGVSMVLVIRAKFEFTTQKLEDSSAIIVLVLPILWEYNLIGYLTTHVQLMSVLNFLING